VLERWVGYPGTGRAQMGLLGALLMKMVGCDLDSFCDEALSECGIAMGLLRGCCNVRSVRTQKNHLHLLFGN
jgi:hypothetical protein